jgi:hypothetical protein
MYVYIYICTYKYTSVHIHEYKLVFIKIFMYIWNHIYIYCWFDTSIWWSRTDYFTYFISLRGRWIYILYICTYIYIYIFRYMRMYIYTYIYVKLRVLVRMINHSHRYDGDKSTYSDMSDQYVSCIWEWYTLMSVTKSLMKRFFFYCGVCMYILYSER